MTPNRQKLVDYNSRVDMADRTSMDVTGIGTAMFQQEDSKRIMTITLKNVLHVPALENNLLSIGHIEKMGLKIVFNGGKAVIMEQNGDVVLEAKRRGRLYEIKEENATAMITKTIDDGLLHRRLEHLNLGTVKKLNKKGGRIENEMSEELDQFETCIKGKMSRFPFPSGVIRTTEPLELVHTDVVGPVEPATKNGSNNKYLITFVDDFSRFTVIFPMKLKSEALDKFKEYKHQVENFHDKRIKTLRSDNGREYRNTEFDEYLAKEGITRQLTIPRTPQQNGVAERYNRTLLDMTICLLLESGITKTLWADAACTASYITNRCPSSAIGGKTPYLMWFGRETKTNHMRVFGCRAWAAITTVKRKLDARAEEYIFIGYPDNAKGYKLWKPEENKFIVSRDVKFDENVFPYKIR